MELEEALDMCDTIISEAEDIEAEAGFEYRDSVIEKAEDIRATIEEYQNVTTGQCDALENMLQGVRKWIR